MIVSGKAVQEKENEFSVRGERRKTCSRDFLRLVILGLSMALNSCEMQGDGDVKNSKGKAEDEVFENNNHKLLLDVEDRYGEVFVDIQFFRAKVKNGPRMAEIFLKYPAGWNCVEGIDGKAVEIGQKQLILQEKEPGLLRVLVLASNNTIKLQTGTIASLRFDRNDGVRGTVEILTDKPIFAPDEANEGLIVGDPVEN